MRPVRSVKQTVGTYSLGHKKRGKKVESSQSGASGTSSWATHAAGSLQG